MTDAAHPATAGGGAAAREFFADGWVRFLSEIYRGDARLIALAFNVEERTAEYWLRGRHIPNGLIVGMAFGLHPEAAARRLRVVVDNAAAPARPAMIATRSARDVA